MRAGSATAFPPAQFSFLSRVAIPFWSAAFRAIRSSPPLRNSPDTATGCQRQPAASTGELLPNAMSQSLACRPQLPWNFPLVKTAFGSYLSDTRSEILIALAGSRPGPYLSRSPDARLVAPCRTQNYAQDHASAPTRPPPQFAFSLEKFFF